MRAWMAVSIAALGLSGVAAPLARGDDPPPITVPTPTVPVPQPDPGPVANLVRNHGIVSPGGKPSCCYAVPAGHSHLQACSGDRRAPHSSFPPGNQEESSRQETQGEGKAEARGGDEAAARARGKGRAEDPLRCRCSRFESRRGFPPDQHAANRSTRRRGVGPRGHRFPFRV